MEEIKRLIEARQVEAMKKQLTPKLMCIVKTLGHGVYGDFGYGSGHSSTPYRDGLDEATPDDSIPEAGGDDYAEVGYVYDSLSIGKNIEIRYMNWDKELRVKLDGHVVYLEADGQLRGYVPSPAWESVVERLYETARPAEAAKKAADKEEEQRSMLRQASRFLKELRQTWGF